MIADALKHRNTKTEEEEKGEYVVLDERHYTNLQNTNFLSSNTSNLTYYRETWKWSVPTVKEDC